MDPIRFALIAVATLLLPILPVSADVVDFDRDVRPILSENCFHCHGPDAKTRQADLRLDTREGLYADLGGYSVIVPGELDASELIRRVASTDEAERMPPVESKLSLSSGEIDVLQRWVATGAEWGGHWAFQPVARPDVPPGASAIDHFVRARLNNEGLALAAPAIKPKLLRRVTFDLTGLPPTLEDLEAFLADEAEGAYEKVVDRLLDSPAYGERMAWDWLDAARYADTNGFQGDSARTMWPWRDWVIRSLNENMPFDQFTIWQLAGDLLPEATDSQKLATGFCRNHMINGEGGRIPEENRIEYIFDQTETLGTVWLGLTLTCCRCHDHKYDPLTQREYYQIFDFFNHTPVDGSGGNPQMPPVIDWPTPSQRDEAVRLEEQLAPARVQLDERKAALVPLQPEWEQRTLADAAEFDEGDDDERKALQEAIRVAVADRSEEQATLVLDRFLAADDEYGQLKAMLETNQQRLDEVRGAIPKVMIMQEIETKRSTFMLSKGLYSQPRDQVDPGMPQVLPALRDDAVGNRLVLAEWLFDPAHPLTPRVTVNRHWQKFFGHGLVKTTEDFGSQGEKPTHPRLLDWLATELVASGWYIKALHKTIVTSATYRQTAVTTTEMHERDPENRLLARGPRFRLASWMLRDQALAASGLLEADIGGPPVRPYQPAGVWEEATFGRRKYELSEGAGLYRRSLYTFWRRIIGPTMFFDVSKRQTCTVKTARTNTPLQALATMNDITYVEAARVLAERAMNAHEPATRRISMAFRLCTSRHPTPAELDVLQERWEILRQQYAAAPDAATQLLGIGATPRDESLDPIDHAAYAGVCLLILNLDETLNK